MKSTGIDFKDCKLGIILVLFILLVIVTETFYKTCINDDDFSALQYTQSFLVLNDSVNLRLQLREINGFVESPPLDSWLGTDGGRDYFSQDIRRAVSSCGYQIYNGTVFIGTIRFQMVTVLVGNVRNCYFYNIESTVAINYVQLNIGRNNGPIPTLRIY
ncbi:hypothetical protein SAMN05444162_4047 [Paenibacillaceae bacterium GAS479]|nr:hypothetical protein SAMN05444162_4047 [Paenibacillaceae bacterium GAS479]